MLHAVLIVTKDSYYRVLVNADQDELPLMKGELRRHTREITAGSEGQAAQILNRPLHPRPRPDR